MISTRRAAAPVLLLATLAAACSDDPQVPDAFIEDAALIAADATLEDVTLWSQPIGAAPSAVDAETVTASDVGVPGGQFGFFGSFSGTREVTFYDAAGNEQDAYDALTTESIHILHEISGEVARDGWSASVSRTRDKTVSGLEGEETERTWNGTGSEEVTRSRDLDDGTERSYSSVGTVEYEDVVVPIPGSDPRWPVSGTVTRTMSVTRSGPDGEVTREVTAVVTFDGSSIALLTVNGEEMEIDLTTRAGRNPLHRFRRP